MLSCCKAREERDSRSQLEDREFSTPFRARSDYLERPVGLLSFLCVAVDEETTCANRDAGTVHNHIKSLVLKAMSDIDVWKAVMTSEVVVVS